MDAAVTLFYERGYRATTVNDIAGALNIRAPSLYKHIGSKQEILRQIMFDGIDAMLAEFEAAVATTDDVADRIRHAAEAHVRHHARRSRIAFVNTYEIQSLEEPARSELLARRRAYTEAWRHLIDDGQRAGVCSMPSVKLAVFSILDLGIGVARWFRPDGELSPETLASYYGDIAMRIVGARPARALRANRIAHSAAAAACSSDAGR
jgi:AcrR family transcriptional regulator